VERALHVGEIAGGVQRLHPFENGGCATDQREYLACDLGARTRKEHARVAVVPAGVAPQDGMDDECRAAVDRLQVRVVVEVRRQRHLVDDLPTTGRRSTVADLVPSQRNAVTTSISRASSRNTPPCR
jgi:hypothetical protein